MSTGRSRTAKIRPNRAIDVDAATPMPCNAVAGPTSRLSMLVNATAVPIVIGAAPWANAMPAIQ